MLGSEFELSRCLLLAVAELHRRGYERLRIAAYMAPSGMYWRCSVTPVSRILAAHGAWEWGSDERSACYSSATGTRYFDWDDRTDDPCALADKFIARFPEIAMAGLGADPEYAAWYSEMLRLTETGALPCAFSDCGDERALAREGILATYGPPPLRPLRMPPPGEAEPGTRQMGIWPHMPLLTPDWVGRTVVVLDSETGGEVLATVDSMVPPRSEGSAEGYILRLHNGKPEPTALVAGPSGVIPGRRGRVVREVRHAADQLFAEMPEYIGDYANGTEAVWVRIRGTAFFPGGSGLWRPSPGDELPPMPHRGVMVVGQDYYTKAGYLRARETGDEVNTPTWRELLKLLEQVGLPEHRCFYTNAWMGLRLEGKPTGKYVGARDPGFTDRCAAFLARQIAVQQPRVIVTLGSEVPPLLARLAPALQDAWGPRPSFGVIDARSAGLVRDVDFPTAVEVRAHVVALVHPSLRNANAGRRRFTTRAGSALTGHAAEVAMLVEGLDALGADPW
jgi:uracil-DNA glycosylase